MRVLVTRPQRAASATAAALRQAGHQPVLAPLFGIEPLDVSWPSGPFEAVLATSAHAFGAATEVVQQWGALPLHVVGARAAAVVSGVWPVATTAPDVKALVAGLVVAHRAPTRFLYLAGRDRKPDLEDALSRAGHVVTVVEVYRAVRVPTLPDAIRHALEAGSLDAVLHFSRRGAQDFRQLVRQAGLEAPARTLLHVAISADAAEPWADVSPRLAGQPDQTGLLAALVDASAGLRPR